MAGLGSLLDEAARSDRLVAEEKLGQGEDGAALAYLARADRYMPKSSLPAEIALADLLLPPIARSMLNDHFGHFERPQAGKAVLACWRMSWT
jgi:hypothetical protein